MFSQAEKEALWRSFRTPAPRYVQVASSRLGAAPRAVDPAALAFAGALVAFLAAVHGNSLLRLDGISLGTLYMLANVLLSLGELF